MKESLNLAELAEACVAVGLCATSSSRGFMLGVPGKRKRCRWRGTAQEHGWLLVILRDVVRKVAPGSYCAPTLTDSEGDREHPLCVLIRDGDMRPLAGVGFVLYGVTETECWARTLVALYRAGLISEEVASA